VAVRMMDYIVHAKSASEVCVMPNPREGGPPIFVSVVF
jgi:hypothetical protein